MSTFERLEIVADGAEQDPDVIDNVTIIKRKHFVARCGVEGFLIEIPESEHRRIIAQLDQLGYDSYTYRQ